MNLERRIWVLGHIFAGLLLVISLRLVYWPLVRGNELQPVAIGAVGGGLNQISGGNPPAKLQELPAPVIQRTADVLAGITRGAIYDRNGRAVAYDYLNEAGNRSRFYTEPSLAHVVGYVTGLRMGATGLEARYDNSLLGLDRLDVQIGNIIHQPIVGSDLILTIDSHLQRVAEETLGDRRGAVVVLDGENGAVLAMASTPHYEPNRMLDGSYVAGLLERCTPGSDCSGIFLNRATQALYTPGSTWKTVALIAALDTGQVDRSTVFDFGRPVQGPNGPYFVYEVDGGIIPDPNHREARLDLAMSYAKSANAAFARIGDEMPPDTMIDYAARLGFSMPAGHQFPIEVEFVPSQLASDVDSLRENNLLRAATAIGQGELLATPLNMAMVVLAVLNDGDMPLPYLVQNARNPEGQLIDVRHNRSVERNIMKPQTAEAVREMMVTTVRSGSGGQAQVQGMTVGGKTGTAQVGGNQAPHAWFIGFAEQDGQSVAIAVMVENAGSGAQLAAPIFAQVATTALRQLGQPVQEVYEGPPMLTQAVRAEAEPEGGETVSLPSPTSLEPDIARAPNKIDITQARGAGLCRGDLEGPQGSGTFQWPSRYHTRSGGDFTERHPGIDLASPEGAAVFAADAGVVIYSGWTDVGYGNVVVIDHGNGYRTLYGHLSQVSTACGAEITAGQVIGLSGNTGNSGGPHLHFEVQVPGGYLNPWNVLPPP